MSDPRCADFRPCARGAHEWVRAGLIFGGLLLLFDWAILAALQAAIPEDQPLPVYFELIRRLDTIALPFHAAIGLGAILVASLRPNLPGIAHWVGAHPFGFALLAFIPYAAGAVLVHHRHPLSMDEYLPVFQSMAFATGHLHGSVPPELLDTVAPREFQGWFYWANRDTGAIGSLYWPAFALLHAPFARLELNWIVNPLITAATLPALDSLLRRLDAGTEIRGAMLLATAGSGAIAVNAMAFYAMPMILLCNIVFTRLILDDSPGALTAAGLVGAIALTALNPVPHALYALPWICWSLVRARSRLRAAAWLSLGYLPIVLVLGLGWPIVYRQLAPAASLGTAGALSSMLAVFGLPSSEIVIARVYAVAKLDLWAVPGLVATAVAGAVVMRGAAARCLVASAALTFGGYLLVPFFQGFGWGYRYFHQAWVVLPVLSAGALAGLAGAPLLQRRALSFFVAAGLGSILVMLPFRSVQIEGFVREILEQVPPRSAGDGRQIVFIDTRCGRHTLNLVQSDPFIAGNELRFAALGPQKDRQTAERLLDRAAMTARLPCAERWTREDDGIQEQR